MSRYSDLPQVQALGDGGSRSGTQMVVIHATDNTAVAKNEASYSRTRSDKTSAHFYVDDNETWQALDTTHIAYGCRDTGNKRSVQFELCGMSNKLTDATIRRAAVTVARVCREFGIPITKIGPKELEAGTKGICGHVDVTNTNWDSGDHTDPGSTFPWVAFIGYVQQAYNGQATEDDMGLTAVEYSKIVQGSITADNALFYWLRRIAEGTNPIDGKPNGVGLPQILGAVNAGTDTLKAQLNDLKGIIVSLADTLKMGGGDVDTAAIFAHMDRNQSELFDRFNNLHQEIQAQTARAEAAEAEMNRLQQVISDAGDSLSKADDQ